MGKKESIASQFGQRLKAERERRAWSQGDVAERLYAKGLPVYATTIGKIEAGKRAIRIDELSAVADLFGVSVDALIGRESSANDLVWTISRITSTAQKCVNEVNSVGERIFGELQDVIHYAAQGPHSVNGLIDTADRAVTALKNARSALSDLADEFPMGN